jgi:polygalacturonase
VGDGMTDNTEVIQAYINRLGKQGGGVLFSIGHICNRLFDSGGWRNTERRGKE